MSFSMFDAIFLAKELLGANFAFVIAFEMFVNGENVTLQTVLAGKVTVALVAVKCLGNIGWIQNDEDRRMERRRKEKEKRPRDRSEKGRETETGTEKTLYFNQ